ncbi:MAG TPA: hypothetical protein VFU32_09535 [Ktedonobacterales bacterium]|nr:hypothetical protein [Ktedonobacterales bacterium]
MTMIDRYIYAVTRRLPEQQREDIAKELRSLIDDLLAERVGAHEATEEDVEMVLAELGEPAKLAAKYAGRPRYIIGPELYDTYLALLKVVLPAVAFAMLLAMTIRYAAAPPQSFGQIFGYLSGTFLWTPLSVVIQVFAWLTVFFALIERSMGESRVARARQAEWKPADLPEVPAQDATIKRSGPIASMVLWVLGFLVFTFATGQFGLFLFTSHGAPILLFRPNVLGVALPLIDLCFAIGLIKESIKLAFGRYTLRLALISTALSGVSLLLALVVFSQFSFWNQDFLQQLAQVFHFTLPTGFDAAQAVLISARVLLGLIIFAFVLEMTVTWVGTVRDHHAAQGQHSPLPQG